MVQIIIGTVEYVRVIHRYCQWLQNAEDQVAKHNAQLQKYMDARERLNNSRRRNGNSLNEKIDYHMAQMTFYQERAEKHANDLRIFQNSFLFDGIPGTPEEWASQIGTTHQARIDFEIQTGRRRPTEPKQEPKEEPEIKEEPTDGENNNIKEEPITMPNVIKSEPQE